MAELESKLSMWERQVEDKEKRLDLMDRERSSLIQVEQGEKQPHPGRAGRGASSSRLSRERSSLIQVEQGEVQPHPGRAGRGAASSR